MFRLQRWWPDSLFTRMLLVQGLLVGAAVLIFSTLLVAERNVVLALPRTALWAPVLRQVALGPIGAPAIPAFDVDGGMRRVAAAPTARAWSVNLFPAVRLLRTELALSGIGLGDIWAVREGIDISYVCVIRVDDAQPVWIRVGGVNILPSWSIRLTAGLLSLIVLIMIISRYFVQRVTQPLARLHARMVHHTSAGVPLAVADVSPQLLARKPPPELKAMEVAYTRLAEQLARNERERALLLAGVSHDLRSPLARIRLIAELLPETTDLDEATSAVTRNVDQADKLVASFLEFVRTSTQRLDETVDAVAVVRQAVAGFNLPARDLVAQLPDRLVLHRASSLLLERLVVNLVENALKHGGMPVQVHMGCVGKTMELTVVDAGPGLPEGGAERLMEAFARGDASRGIPGFGLGLAIVQQIVTRLQGELLFERSPVGHRVQVVVPLGR
jgi:two-component system osmolarity sensor histidine kinase EnvZ